MYRSGFGQLENDYYFNKLDSLSSQIFGVTHKVCSGQYSVSEQILNLLFDELCSYSGQLMIYCDSHLVNHRLVMDGTYDFDYIKFCSIYRNTAIYPTLHMCSAKLLQFSIGSETVYTKAFSVHPVSFSLFVGDEMKSKVTNIMFPPPNDKGLFAPFWMYPLNAFVLNAIADNMHLLPLADIKQRPLDFYTDQLLDFVDSNDDTDFDLDWYFNFKSKFWSEIISQSDLFDDAFVSKPFLFSQFKRFTKDNDNSPKGIFEEFEVIRKMVNMWLNLNNPVHNAMKQANAPLHNIINKLNSFLKSYNQSNLRMALECPKGNSVYSNYSPNRKLLSVMDCPKDSRVNLISYFKEITSTLRNEAPLFYEEEWDFNASLKCTADVLMNLQSVIFTIMSRLAFIEPISIRQFTEDGHNTKYQTGSTSNRNDSPIIDPLDTTNILDSPISNQFQSADDEAMYRILGTSFAKVHQLYSIHVHLKQAGAEGDAEYITLSNIQSLFKMFQTINSNLKSSFEVQSSMSHITTIFMSRAVDVVDNCISKYEMPFKNIQKLLFGLHVISTIYYERHQVSTETLTIENLIEISKLLLLDESEDANWFQKTSNLAIKFPYTLLFNRKMNYNLEEYQKSLKTSKSAFKENDIVEDRLSIPMYIKEFLEVLSKETRKQPLTYFPFTMAKFRMYLHLGGLKDFWLHVRSSYPQIACSIESNCGKLDASTSIV